MKKLKQTRFSNKRKGEQGNCLATCIACFMNKKSAEEVIQIQDYYNDPRWVPILLNWLVKEGYIMYSLNGHSRIKDEFYLVIGKSPRSTDKEEITHVCIYQNGELYFDPHPDNTGLLTEYSFEMIEKIK